MIFKRLNRTSPEQVFAVFQSNDANTAADAAVCLDTTSGTVNGVKVVQPASANLLVNVGIADAAIANGAYGLVQIYGYRSTSQVVHVASSLALNRGMAAVSGQNYLSTTATDADALTRNFVTLETHTAADSVTHSVRIFIRCM